MTTLMCAIRFSHANLSHSTLHSKLCNIMLCGNQSARDIKEGCRVNAVHDRRELM